ncbi:MAG: hypothetical protein M0R46_03335 [Candidatus Muirbacterium halophilum]|nr:hypothetical protein [Candidatus Muirbacterium halophilum]MCK9474922.1 hypothetical protein [Candidatus Muirbacterium halophilum]
MKKSKLNIFLIIFIFTSFFTMAESEFSILDNKEVFMKNLKTGIKAFFNEKDRDKVFLNIPELKSYNYLTGYIPFIEVKAENVFVDDLRTDFVYMYLYNIKLDKDKLIKKNEFIPGEDMRIRFHAEISQKNLNELLESKNKKIKVNNPKAILKPNNIYLYGNVKAVFLSSNIKIKGSFYVEDEKKINFQAEYIALERVKMPKFLLSKFVSSMNPVIDLERNRFDIRVSRIEILNEKFIISSFDKDEVESFK